jgi:CxxC motif-containing protein (DUF1111 family)
MKFKKPGIALGAAVLIIAFTMAIDSSIARGAPTSSPPSTNANGQYTNASTTPTAKRRAKAASASKKKTTAVPSIAVKDPGVRGGPAGAGGPIAGLTPGQLALFNEGKNRFEELETVPSGLGPVFNAEQCAQCHANPSAGGTSPSVNPQVAIATDHEAKNTVPSFITINGPVREVRFKKNPDGTPDGGVHDLYTISGRTDLPQPNSCSIAQPDFANALKHNNAIFRIPTPVFGAGLIESIPDPTILGNSTATAAARRAYGIKGHVNRTAGVANHSGNDGTITRFGWKAQNKSLIIFGGEAYNVEEGITNEAFPNERNTTAACLTTSTPEDVTDPTQSSLTAGSSDVTMFAYFMRTLAPPQPVNQTDLVVVQGRNAFSKVGCALCHTPALQTGNATIAALNNQTAHLWSDLLLHNMGNGLADGISQGNASGNEFRTAPLWGIGQRLFFMHDGRTNDLLVAIEDHASRHSEANQSVKQFNKLSAADRQAILVFLRSL